MANPKEILKEKHQRLQTALKRVPADKPDARKSILGDIRKVELEFEALNKGGGKKKKPISSITLLLISIGLATIVGFIIYYVGSGNL